MESGPCDTVSYLRDKNFAYSTVDELASRLGCNITDSAQQLNCLRLIPSDLLVAVAANVSIPPSASLAFKDQINLGGVPPFCLIVDGIETPVHLLQAFLSGTFNHVPMLMGATRDVI